MGLNSEIIPLVANKGSAFSGAQSLVLPSPLCIFVRCGAVVVLHVFVPLLAGVGPPDATAADIEAEIARNAGQFAVMSKPPR